ncbi:MAG: hypothetical protein DELT_02192 [Desulfovibrio sp.]
MKKILLAVVAVAVLVVAWYIYTGGTMSLKAAKKQLVKEAQQAVLENAAPEDVAALAMKAINMTQGEHGAELWRLKAEWGNVRRKDNIMELEKPSFTYYMAPDNLPLTVTSEKGEVDQEEQRVTFIGSVVATHQDKVVKAPVMVYSGKNRDLVCPEGAGMTGDNMVGSANRIVWDLNAKLLTGLGDVDMSFENAAVPVPPRTEEGQTAPAAGGPQG